MVKVEIANTPEAREFGLMYRNNWMTARECLYFSEIRRRAEFWMKNTVITLDMFFADSSGKVLGIVANARP